MMLKIEVIYGQCFQIRHRTLAAVAVGTTIGLILDNWFDIKPWFIIIFFFSTAAGTWNVIRTANRMQKED